MGHVEHVEPLFFFIKLLRFLPFLLLSARIFLSHGWSLPFQRHLGPQFTWREDAPVTRLTELPWENQLFIPYFRNAWKHLHARQGNPPSRGTLSTYPWGTLNSRRDIFLPRVPQITFKLVPNFLIPKIVFVSLFLFLFPCSPVQISPACSLAPQNPWEGLITVLIAFT